MVAGRIRRTAPVAGATILLLAGCATSGGEPARPRPVVTAGEFGTPDCFLRRVIDDFEVLDDRNVIVFAAGGAEAYHVQVSPPASELRFANALAFESRSSRLCGYAGDSLLLDDAGAGARRLGVTGVFRLDPLAVAGLRARFGRSAQPAAPQDPRAGAGATIERDLERSDEHRP